MSVNPSPPLSTDHQPSIDAFRTDVIEGLSQRRKTIPCKYLYDEQGSQLFDRICETKEYYLTRTELAIMEGNRRGIADAVGSDAMLIEPGAGSTVKVRLLLESLDSPAAYVPLDISGDHLAQAAATLARDFPDLEILPVHADFNEPFELPPTKHACGRRLVYFPGSTIGNFEADERLDLLHRMAEIAETDGRILIGVDLVKDPRTLEAAYDDASGATAAFSLNLLDRVNRELGADFDIDSFTHRSFWDPHRERIEINLVSLKRQTVRLDDHAIEFEENEAIQTEYSHKFRVDSFATVAESAGLRLIESWTDDRDWFAVLCFATD